MKKFIVLAAVLALALIVVPMAQAGEVLSISSNLGTSIQVNATDVAGGIGTFSFVNPGVTAINPSGADFTVTLSDPFGIPPIGDLGFITNPVGGFVITGPILPEGTAEYSAVSGTGSLKIETNSSNYLTADLTWVKIETNSAGTSANLNDKLVANITNLAITGTVDPGLQALYDSLAGVAGIITFQTGGTSTNPITLTDLTTGTGVKDTSSYSGTISAIPLPPSALLVGSGLLGLLALRRKKLFTR